MEEGAIEEPATTKRRLSWRPSHFVFGPDQDELAYPAHHMVLETASRNQGSELSGATMIPQMTVVTDLTRSED